MAHSLVSGPAPSRRWGRRPRCSFATVHFVIMGCGRVGAMLARALEGQGHDVAVVDQDPTAFRRLGHEFSGQRVRGIGFDRNTLKEAGTEHAYALAAVSNGDNSNILTARVARETFGVEHVVARIYDPRRAEIYQRLGIPTVATVQWTVDRVIRRLLPQGAVAEFTDPSGQIALSEVAVNPEWIGQPLRRIEAVTGARVAYLSRLGAGMLPTPETVFQDGDLLKVLTPTTAIDDVQGLLDQPPPHD